MPSHLHEVLIELFRSRPSLVVEVLADPLRLDVPAHARARLASGELTDVTPTEYRADAVVMLTDTGGRPVLAVVVEVQLSRDRGKRKSWPVYVSTLYARLDCPTILLVVCPDPAVAAWCATPVDAGHQLLVQYPLVLGPQVIPVITDPDQACQHPEQAVLSALAHGGRRGQDGVLRALLAGLTKVDQDHAVLYADLVLAQLPEAARRYLEELMAMRTYEYQSDFARRYFSQGRTEGRTEGEVRALLAILSARDIQVPDDAHARITATTDLDQLDTWIRRAVTATTIHDLFD
jgi:hypothetical protein